MLHADVAVHFTECFAFDGSQHEPVTDAHAVALVCSFAVAYRTVW